MRKFFAFLCLVVATSAHGSVNSSEISDLWYAPGEDGWGLNMVLQNNVAFATFYVYDVNRNPVWFTAVLQYSPGYVFSGDVFADRGPWYGGPYSPPSTERRAGTARFTLSDLNNAVLTYVIDGVTVTKNMQRLTWTNENLSGTWLFQLSTFSTNCNPSQYNGLLNVNGVISIVQSGTAVTMSLNGENGTCTFNGAYSQYGKLGQMAGSYSCTSSSFGTYTWFELTPTISGFTGRVTGQNQFCAYTGYLSGTRQAQ